MPIGIGVLIRYDAEFPELARTGALAGATARATPPCLVYRLTLPDSSPRISGEQS